MRPLVYDEEVKEIVSRLIEEIGFRPLDTGVLPESTEQEPGAKIYNRDLVVKAA